MTNPILTPLQPGEMLVVMNAADMIDWGHESDRPYPFPGHTFEIPEALEMLCTYRDTAWIFLLIGHTAVRDHVLMNVHDIDPDHNRLVLSDRVARVRVETEFRVVPKPKPWVESPDGDFKMRIKEVRPKR